jgi:hypothetical protein
MQQEPKKHKTIFGLEQVYRLPPLVLRFPFIQFAFATISRDVVKHKTKLETRHGVSSPIFRKVQVSHTLVTVSTTALKEPTMRSNFLYRRREC